MLLFVNIFTIFVVGFHQLEIITIQIITLKTKTLCSKKLFIQQFLLWL